MNEIDCYFAIYGRLIFSVPHYNKTSMSDLILIAGMAGGGELLWRILNSRGDVHKFRGEVDDKK